MGWSWGLKPANVKQELIDNLTFETDTFSQRVLDIAIVKLSEVYAAVERTDKATGEKRVCAAVTMIRFSRGEMGCKDMSEADGPTIRNCPERILKLLTPRKDEGLGDLWANEWREECWRNIEARKNLKLKRGDVVTFPNPIEFTNGDRVQNFLVESIRPLRVSDADRPMSYFVYQMGREKILREGAVVNPPMEGVLQDA